MGAGVGLGVTLGRCVAVGVAVAAGVEVGAGVGVGEGSTVAAISMDGLPSSVEAVPVNSTVEVKPCGSAIE